MKITKVLSVLLTALWVLLLFFLIFENKLAISGLLVPVGRLHPLILHLPIGLFFGLWLLWIVRKQIDEQIFKNLYQNFTLIISILAVLTAVAGLFLSKENGSDEGHLNWHKYTGSAFAFLCVILYEFNFPEKKLFLFTKIIGSLLLLISGHFGGEITHGEGFLLGSKETENTAKLLTDDSDVFKDGVMPILEKKCIVCHNDQKTKGQLNMTSVEKLLKGGKNGAAIKINDALNSHIIQRAKLPLDDKKHMPPKSKPQLTEVELKILTEWINHGAKISEKMKDIKSLPAYYSLFFQNQPKKEIEQYNLPFASESLIEKLNTPFCTVEPIATGSPALKAAFYVSGKYDSKKLKGLNQVSEQLVDLNLAKMPLKNADMEAIGSFKQLRKLNLNATGIKTEDLGILKQIPELISVSLSNNQLNDQVLGIFSECKKLKEVFLWETGINAEKLKQWSIKHPNIKIETGFNPQNEPPIKLNIPTVVQKNRVLNQGESIQLKHPLNGVEIRFTTDGSEPDSIHSTKYDQPIKVSGFQKIKMKAYKSGWISSNTNEATFFISNIKTNDAQLLKPADKQYQGNGAATLIDGKAGDVDNFRDGSWLGFRNNAAEFVIATSDAKGISLSWLTDAGSYIMPPKNISIYGSDDGKTYKLIKNDIPEQLKNYVPKHVNGYNLSFNKSYKYVKVIMQPINSLPQWHEGKGQKGWVFIDEVYLW